MKTFDISLNDDFDRVLPAMTQPVNFDIRGMTCGGCSMRVQHVLERLDGVGKVDVKLHPGFVTMVIDPGRVTPGQIVTAIAKVGFAATATARGLEGTRGPDPRP